MVWFVLAGLTAVAVLAAIWPLLRGSAPNRRDIATSSEAAFHRAQLDEIERDVERGILPESEAASARAEAARRLLAASATGPAAGKTASYGRARLAAAALVVVGFPALAVPLYVGLGQPEMRDAPLAGREPAQHAASDLSAAVAGVEKHLIAQPDDGKGWAVLAPIYMRLERYDDAVNAYSSALRLLGEDPTRRAAYGEALVASAGGVVTASARESFARALAADPKQPQARFYLALAAEQEGRTAEAIRGFEGLAADAPPGAPYVEAVRARIAALEGKGEPPQAEAAASAANSPQQQAMIEGMVSRLAERLAAKGGSLDEWARLVRAYSVLHQDDKARAALADAKKALASDAGAVASLDALAREAGIDGAAKANPQPAAAAAPNLGPPQQQAMIEGMVNRLAERLAAQGGGLDEWARLIRAYSVLHQDEKARAALADAKKALAPDAGAVARLDALARDLGLNSGIGAAN